MKMRILPMTHYLRDRAVLIVTDQGRVVKQRHAGLTLVVDHLNPRIVVAVEGADDHDETFLKEAEATMCDLERTLHKTR